MINVPYYIIYLYIMFIPIIAIVLIMCVTTHEDSRQMVMASFFKRFGVWAVCLIIASFQIQQDIESRKPTPTIIQPDVKQEVVDDKPIAKTEEVAAEESVASEPIIPNQIDIKPVAVPKPDKVTDEMAANAISFVTSYTIIQNAIKSDTKECMKKSEDIVLCERQAYSNVNMKYEYRDALHATYKQQMAIIEDSKK